MPSPSPVPSSGKRPTPKTMRTIAKTTTNSQGPIPNTKVSPLNTDHAGNQNAFYVVTAFYLLYLLAQTVKEVEGRDLPS